MPSDPAARLIRHQSMLGEWELVIRQPDPYLRSYVIEYQGYLETAATRPIRRREVPWPGVVLIINFGPAFRITDRRQSEIPCDYGSFVAGLYDSYVITESTGLSYCMQVNFTPIGGYLFFGLPMDQIANRVVPLEDLVERQDRTLAQQLYDFGSWDERFGLLDRVIARRIAAARPPLPEILWAWRRLLLPQGEPAIGALARELGWSRKRLVGRFREQLGLSPKALARIIRFDRVIRQLDRVPVVHWAELACDAGYYDQAHLNRDFRQLAGSAPGEFLRRRVPDGGNLED